MEEHMRIQGQAFHKALADPIRLRLFEAASSAPRPARELATAVGMSTNRLYHHLGLLIDAGLLEVAEYRPLPGGKVERVYGPAKQEPPADDASPEDLARFLNAVIATAQADASQAWEAKARGSRRDIVFHLSTLELTAAAFLALRADFERAVQEASTHSGDGPSVRVIWGLIDREDRTTAPEERPPS